MSLRELKEEKVRRLRDNKYKYYVPTGVGEQFIEKVGSDNYFITLFSAANGVGKTYVGAHILAHLFWPCGSDWFQYPLFRKWPYKKRVRIISEPTTIVSTLIPILKEVFPKGRYKMDKKGKNYEYWWTTDTGWEFEIMSYDQDPKEFESATIGLIWFDEPPPERIYKASVARLRKGGEMFITATPLMGSAWMYDHIICNKYHAKGQRTYIEADVSSACIEHGERGFLKHSDIEKMIAEYSDDEKHARILGKFAHLTGLVYKQWDRRVHVIRPFQITMQDYCVIEMIDPHPRNNDAISWIAIDKYGQKFVCDELWLKCQGGTEELAQRIKQKAGQYRIVRRLGDPSMFITDQHSEKSLATRLADFGLHYLPATKTRTASNQRLGDALNFTKRGDEFIKTPEMYWFETCQQSIYEMEHWRWDEWRGKVGDDKNRKEKPIDKDDHFIENCLSGETIIDLKNGRKKIKELVGTQGEIKTISGIEKYFDVRMTQKNVKVYRITFNNGKFVEATRDHLILSAKNEWKKLLDYNIGEKILDIGISIGYNREYESKNYIYNKTRIQWRKILVLWKVFWQELQKQITPSFAQGSLDLPQWQNSERLRYSSQGRKQEKQSDREFSFDETRLSSNSTYDERKKKLGKREYEKQCFAKSGRMAQIFRSEVALRQIKNKDERILEKQKTDYQKKVRGVWQKIFITSQKFYLLLQKMQIKRLGYKTKVKKIVYIGKQNVYNMEVENIHCFSVNGGIIVHNCGRAIIQEPSFVPYTRINKSYEFAKEDTGVIGGDGDPFE